LDWIRALEAEGSGLTVIKHLIEPMLGSLTVEHAEPMALLRDIRDQRIIADLPGKVLAKLAVLLKERRKKLVSTKDVLDLAPEASKGFEMRIIYADDPSWQAWCDNLDARGFDAYRKFCERAGVMKQWTEWPPERYANCSLSVVRSAASGHAIASAGHANGETS
jgi:hypothetical protein